MKYIYSCLGNGDLGFIKIYGPTLAMHVRLGDYAVDQLTDCFSR